MVAKTTTTENYVHDFILIEVKPNTFFMIYEKILEKV